MNPSSWNAPEPTTVSSAILFHCCAAFPGGSAAARGAAVAPTTATATSAEATRASLAVVFIPSSFGSLPREALPSAALMQYGICRRLGLVRVLPERDVAALLAVVGELAGLDAPVAFPPEFVGTLGQLVGCDVAAFSVLDRRNEVTVFASTWDDGDVGMVADDSSDNRYWELRHSHPLCSWRERQWTWGGAHTVSQFASTREFRRTAIWDEVFR